MRGRTATPTALVAALLLASWPASAGGQLRLLAVDGAVRVDPVRVAVIEGWPGLPPGGPRPGYLDSNPVFDRERGLVTLQAARNETVAFQLVVLLGDRGAQRLEVRFDRLEGPASLARGGELSIFRALHVRVDRASSHQQARRASTLAETWFPVGRYTRTLHTHTGPGTYPDALLPLDGPEAVGLPGFPMSVPDRVDPAAGRRARTFWVDVRVPRDAPPGRYSGPIVVTADGERESLEVVLDVLPVTLPDEHHSGVGSISYDFVGIHLASLGPEVFHRFFRLVHSHRLTVDPMYLHPDWREDGSIDWAGYDALVAPLLDGSAFSFEAGYVGAGQGRAVRRFVLPVDWNWPLRPGASGYDEAFVAALRQSEEHLVRGDDPATTFSLFVNTTDEPRDEETFALVRRYGELAADSGVRRDRIRYRLDAGPFKSIASELPGWTLSRIFAELGPFVDIWAACGGVPFAPAEALRRRVRTHPDEAAWVYFSNAAGEPAMGSALIDAEALGPRTWAWIAWRYELAAVVSWEIGWPDPGCLRRPDCSGHGLLGDASLVYLGDSLGARGTVLPSIRLKNLRRGAEDHEYLWLLAEAGHRELADAYAERLVPRALDDGLVEGMRGAWEHDPAAWDEVRREMGLVLAGLLPPPDPEAVRRRAPRMALPAIGLTRRKALVAAALVAVVLLLAGGLPELLRAARRPTPVSRARRPRRGPAPRS